MEENEDIKEAKEELEKISQDDILRRRALSRTLDIADKIQFEKEATERGLEKGMAEGLEKGMAQGMAQGMTKGIAQGIAQGKNEGRKAEKIEIIKEMYKANIPVEQIAKIVKLEENEVKEILKIK